MTVKAKAEIDVKDIPTDILLREAKLRREAITKKLGPHGIKRKPRTCKACGKRCKSTREWRSHPCVTPSWFKTVDGQRVIVR